MATEEQKKKNLFRMMSMMIAGMAKSLYELFGDTAFATMTEVGKELLEIMENEMGLEIAGETPKDVLTEIGRIFADEYGQGLGIYRINVQSGFLNYRLVYSSP